MLLSEFSKKIGKGQFAGTELPVIEKTSHTYETHGKNIRRKGRSHHEPLLRNRRMSTARRVLDEGYNADNTLLLADGDLKLNINPYLKHAESGWQDKPGGRGSEKNDDRRTRTPWVADLEKKKWREKIKRQTDRTVKDLLFRRRVDPYSWSDKPNYKR